MTFGCFNFCFISPPIASSILAASLSAFTPLVASGTSIMRAPVWVFRTRTCEIPASGSRIFGHRFWPQGNHHCRRLWGGQGPGLRDSFGGCLCSTWDSCLRGLLGLAAKEFGPGFLIRSRRCRWRRTWGGDSSKGRFGRRGGSLRLGGLLGFFGPRAGRCVSGQERARDGSRGAHKLLILLQVTLNVAKLIQMTMLCAIFVDN